MSVTDDRKIAPLSAAMSFGGILVTYYLHFDNTMGAVVQMRVPLVRSLAEVLRRYGFRFAKAPVQGRGSRAFLSFPHRTTAARRLVCVTAWGSSKSYWWL